MHDRIAVIFNRFSQKSLDVPNGNAPPGTPLQQFGYHGGSNQLWRVRDAGQGTIAGQPAQRFYILSDNSSGQAITVDSSGDIVLRPPDPAPVFAHSFGQLWYLQQLPQLDPLDPRLYLIRNTRTDQVLRLRSESNADNIQLELSAVNSGERHQQWEVLYKFEPTTVDVMDIMVIFGVNSGKCLDVPGSNPGVVDIQQFTYNGGRNQFWAMDSLSADSRGTHARIRTVHTPGMALDLRDPDGISGTPLEARMRVVQRQISTAVTQMWNIRARGDFFLIDNDSGFWHGRVLDVVWGNRADGALIQVHQPHGGPNRGGANQLWQIWVSEPFAHVAVGQSTTPHPVGT